MRRPARAARPRPRPAPLAVDKEVLSVADVMRLTGLGRHLVYASLATRGGWIPVLPLDNLVRIPRRKFLEALDRRTVTEGAKTAKTAKR